MTAPTDLSLMDFLFEREDPILNLSDKEYNAKIEPKINMSLDSWPSNTDDFLDSLLKFDHPFEILDDSELMSEPVTLHATDELVLDSNCLVTDDLILDSNCSVADEVVLDSNCSVKDELVVDSNYSDSGVSSDQQLSPMLLDADDDDPGYFMSSLSSGSENSPITSSHLGSDHESLMQEEIELDSSVFNVLDTSTFGEVKLEDNKAVISMDILPNTQQKEKLILSNLHKRRTPKPARQVIRVTPVMGNPRSILLPVSLKDVKEFKTIKIINAASSGLHQKLQSTIAGFRAGTSATVSSLRTKAGLVKRVMVQDDVMSDNSSKEPLSSGETSDDSSSFPYPRLQLSLEEKRLLKKEGVRLPSHYPLTKLEERELKRIRRKIRNKISAQDSRKRKKEYIDGLEDRVKHCTEENLHLVKRIKALQNQNQTLSSQLKKLHVALSRGTTKSAQPSTCLMVLMISMALVMVPNLRPNQTSAQTELDNEQDLVVPESKLPPLAGRSRSLLYSQSLAPEDSFLMDEDSDDKHRQLMSGIEDLLQFNSPLMDHDYEPPPTKRTRTKDPIKLFPPKGYVIPPVDDLWPPPTPSDTIITHKVETMASQLKVNVSEPGGHRTVVLQVPKEQ